MADDHTARLTARQERIRQEQVADANQQLIDRINTLVGVIGHQNNTQADTNCLIQDAIGGGGGALQWLLLLIASLIIPPKRVLTSTRQ